MAEPNMVIRPQAGPQEQFLATPADIAIYGGSAGSGKSWALLLEPLRHINNKKFGAVFFRRTLSRSEKKVAFGMKAQSLLHR